MSSAAVQALLEPGHEVLQTGEALKEVALLSAVSFFFWFSLQLRRATFWARPSVTATK